MNDATTNGEYQTPASIPMYLAALIVTGCGLFAVNLLLDDTSFASLTLGLALIGFFVSYLSRKMKIAPRNIELPAVVICAFFSLLAVISDQMLTILAPPSVGDDRAKALAVLLTWLVVFRSFTLLTDGALLFCCVPTIAMMGLVGTMTSEFTLITAFIVFVCAAAFMMVHENFLRTRPLDGTFRRAAMERVLFGSQVQLAALCGLGAVMLANIVAAPLRTIGSALLFSTSLTNQATTTTQDRSASRVLFSEQGEYRIAAGPVTLSDRVVMRVKAENGAYWRGATLDEYTGHSWKISFPNGLSLPPSVPDENFLEPSNSNLYTYRIPETEYTQVSRKSHSLRQTVTLLSGGLFGEVYAAAEPRAVQSAISMQMSRSLTGSIHLNEQLQNVVYFVTSQVPDWTSESLRTVRAPYPPEIRRYYLQLPQEAAIEHIRETARQVTAGLSNAFDKVTALEKWIGQQCKYNTNTPAAPADQDVVDYFLFAAQEGYCDSFAAALAILCRSIDIPARVASGFRPGELERVSQYDPSQEYFVRERDKHQWTEVYFPTVGWIAFDATDFAEDISGAANDARANKRYSLYAFLFGRGWLPPMALFVFLCMLGYVVKVEVWDKRRARNRLTNPLGLPETNLFVVEAYDTACALFARRGLARPASATPSEYLTRLDDRLAAWPAARAALERLTRLVVRFRYSREVATAEDVRLAHQALLELQQALRGVSRRSLLAAAPGAGGA